jgi:hypothetical protein
MLAVESRPDRADVLLAYGRLLADKPRAVETSGVGDRAAGCAMLVEAVGLYTTMALPEEGVARETAERFGCV